MRTTVIVLVVVVVIVLLGLALAVRVVKQYKDGELVHEREKRAKIINAEGESLAAAALGDASDTMMAHPLAPQLAREKAAAEPPPAEKPSSTTPPLNQPDVRGAQRNGSSVGASA